MDAGAAGPAGDDRGAAALLTAIAGTGKRFIRTSGAEAVAKLLGLAGAVAVTGEDFAQALGPLPAQGLGSNSRVDSARARTELGWVPQGPPLLDELVQGSYRRIWGPQGRHRHPRTAGRVTETPGHFTAGRRVPEPGEQGKGVPCSSVYDLGVGTGRVSVGSDGDTAQFAVQTIRRWWTTALANVGRAWRSTPACGRSEARTPGAGVPGSGIARTPLIAATSSSSHQTSRVGAGPYWASALDPNGPAPKLVDIAASRIRASAPVCAPPYVGRRRLRPSTTGTNSSR